MKKFASNDNLLDLIKKEYLDKIPINSINQKNYLMNRNQTIYELDKLFNKEIIDNKGMVPLTIIQLQIKETLIISKIIDVIK